jgi:hypothetical protein
MSPSAPAPEPPPPLPPSEPFTVRPRVSALAVVSLVLGVLGFVTVGLTGVVGLILGIVALSQIRRQAGQLTGRSLAIAGIAVSAVTLLFGALAVASLGRALDVVRGKAADSAGVVVYADGCAEPVLAEKVPRSVGTYRRGSHCSPCPPITGERLGDHVA